MTTDTDGHNGDIECLDLFIEIQNQYIEQNLSYRVSNVGTLHPIAVYGLCSLCGVLPLSRKIYLVCLTYTSFLFYQFYTIFWEEIQKCIKFLYNIVFCPLPAESLYI